ncbi:FixH family protein [Sulfidibacter corallicola]|uniref:FixH family protein n=1 Tax=Sulfidibacter corallicola TaxID=2818388 RepID=A0A8A4U4K8_SULCO|nr:FixH family protein [Sulfidibacter corallicola]QTD53685.1 FixH family protein [Sulfidibacter corallicola]
MNYWKYIVMSLLASVAIFHVGAVWYISGREYELTSPDYYQKEQVYEETMRRYRLGREWDWRVSVSEETGFQLVIRDGDGLPVVAESVKAHLMRPNQASADLALELGRTGEGVYHAPVADLPAGRWNLEIEVASGADVAAYRSHLDF